MTARELAWKMLIQVNEQDGLSHHVMNKAFSEHALPEVERAFATRLFHGTLERQLTIDWILEHQAHRPMCKVKPKIRNLLRVSAYQLLFMDQVPPSAVCNEAVKLIKQGSLSGLSGFVNGVLRGLSREIEQAGGREQYQKAFAEDMTETERLCFWYSMPVWLVSYWRERYPKATTEKMLRAFLDRRGVTLRCNESKGTPEELVALLEEEKIVSEPGLLPNTVHVFDAGSPAECLAYQQGRFRVQDESSVLVGNLLPLERGMRVLDLCAAPGGKSLHVADRLRVLGDGTVEARDLRQTKVDRITEQKVQLAFEHLHCVVADATEYDAKLEGSADIVLADLPCSGLGVIGKKPDIKWKTTYEDVLALAKVQRSILKNAVRYVKPGGYLMYSTCTVTTEENDDNSAFLRGLSMVPVAIADRIPETFGGVKRDEEAVQLFPESGVTDGFFLALFRREK